MKSPLIKVESGSPNPATSNLYTDILTPSTPECDFIWKQVITDILNS